MKLLYAEDEEEMSEAVVDILTYHKYTVDAVYDGEEALSYAHAEQYDGIILDVMMPKKSGRELVLQVKNTCEKLPEVEPEKLFERFYRGDAARTQKSGGYGIGLSAARAIALAHGGTLGASYEKDDIICFTLRLKEP